VRAGTDARRPGAAGGAATVAAPPAWRSRRWAIAGTLSVTETVSWGVLYYAFAVFLVPMRESLGFSTAQLTGAFSLGLAVSAPAGIAVGRWLDRRSPRGPMTAGSLAGAALVAAWSQVDGLAALYALWAAIGVVMALVLYEPAFTVLAKHFPHPAERRRAMTAMTLVAALASFIFLPLSQALIEAHGWRSALLVLAAILAALTVPLHALVLRPAPAPAAPASEGERPAPAGSVPAARALRSAPFWLLSAAFFLASLTAIAVTVHAVAFLLGRGHSAAFAAFAVGVIGISQIPGRLLFAPLAARWPRPHATASLFVLIGAGVALLVGAHATWLVVAGLVLLGMGNGMGTLARATAIADLFGPGAYGTISSVAAALTTAARAGGPVAAALVAAVVGYGALLWGLAALALLAAVLAFRAETLAHGRGVALAASPPLHSGPARAQ
jgi:MFS family permease